MSSARPRRPVWPLLAALLLLVTSAAGLAFAPVADAALVDPFIKVFGTNTNGDVLIRGNSSMSCSAAVTGCQAVRDTVGGGTTSNQNLNNNNWNMAYSNSDTTTAGVFDSSSSSVTLPAGSTVLFAALVWSARTDAGTNGAAAPDATAKGTVRLRTPGASGYTTVTSSRTSTSDAYQGYADVTSLVTAGGSGDYTVANIQAATGQDRYAGWSLAIAYADPTAPLRNLSIFSGFATVSTSSGNSTVDIPVSGFTTPPSGSVRTTIGAVSWEGDLGSTGDSLQVGPDATHLTSLSDALHASTNVFTSVISTRGTDTGGRTPNYHNNMGVDLATITADGALTNGSTSAVVRFTTSSETYFPGLMSFASNLYAPQIDLTKTASFTKAAGNTQSQLLEAGDTVTYAISGTNSGSDAAAPTVLTDTVPAGTTYVPGSLKLAGSSVTDATGDDLGSYSSGTQTLTAYLGTGATASAGGTVAIGASIAPVSFQVTVDPVTTAESLTNTARIDYTGVTSGRAVFGASNTLLAVAYQHRSDLGVTLTQDIPVVQRGAATSVTYHATVTNSGPYDEPAAVLSGVLPAGATVVSATPSTGTCTTTGPPTCALGAMASGETRTIDFVLRLDGSPRLATTSASVAGSNADVVPADDTASVTTLVNTAPVAVADSVTAGSGGSVTFDPAGNDTDADPDTLAVTSVTGGSRGTVVLNGNGSVTYTASAGQAGPDSFTYVVSDGHGGTATGTVSVTVPNTPPVAQDDATSTTSSTPVDIAVLANDTDANIPTLGAQSLSVSSFTQPAGGKGTVAASGSGLRFTPSSTFHSGTATFTYTVSDGAGGTSVGTVTVTLANSGPVAAADTATTDYATTVDVPVLVNDTDPDGDPLTLTGVQGAAHGTATVVAGKVHYVPDSGWSGTDTLTYTISDGRSGTATGTLVVTTGNASPTAGDLTASVPGGADSVVDVLAHAADPNNDTLTVVGTGVALHGSVSVDGTGHVHYLPDPAYRGPDHFTYTVSDGHGGTATGTVDVTVANQAPHAVADTAVVPVNGSVDVTVLVNDTDANGDPLSVTASATTAHGTVVVHPDGSLTYTPDAGYEGQDTVSYTVSDGHGGTDTATVTVTVADTPPVAVADTVDYQQQTGTPLTIDVLGNDTDANGDPLHVVTFDAGSVHGGTVTLVGGQLVYLPDPTYVGTDTFTYTVGDSRGGIATTTVTVHVIDRSPVALDDTAQVQRDTPTLIDVLANDTDPDGEALAVHAVEATSAHGGRVVIVGGQVRYTPPAGYSGEDSFDYAVIDPRGVTSTATVHLGVADSAPQPRTDAPVLRGPAGGSHLIDVVGNDSDPDGDSVHLVSVGTPGHGTVTIVDGRVRYTPDPHFAGTDTFTYVVADAFGMESVGTVEVTVVNRAPVTPPSTYHLSGGRSGRLPVMVHVSDPDGEAVHIVSVSATSTKGGTVRLRNGLPVYTPRAGFRGTDTFTYTVTDPRGATSTATVTMIVGARTVPAAGTDTGTTGTSGTTGAVSPYAPQGGPAAAQAGTLPDTGGPSRTPLVGGLLLVLTGAALMARGRRVTRP